MIGQTISHYRILNQIGEGGMGVVYAVEIIEDVACALAEAHRRGVVHRDIKPSNVLIDNRGEVKVLDFGLAKQLDEASDGEGGDGASSSHARTIIEMHTRSDVVVGTPLYLSPEQARGAPVDRRSDLFALGALLYECVAGRPAFSGANVIEIGAQVLHINPPPPSQFNPRVTPELDRVTLKALAKKPEERYQKADEMAAELESARAKLSTSDTTRTRRLATQAGAMRSSALMTLSDTLRRPRLSPLAFLAALGVVLLGVWAFASWRAPKGHQPLPGAVESYNRGMDAMRAGAYFKASRELEEAVRRDSKFALAHASLAEAWAEQDYLDHAKDELLAVSTLVPERKVLSELEALYLDAVTATVRREYAEAVKSYEEVARRGPESAQAYLDLGRAYEKNDEMQKAIYSYVKATNLAPQDATAFLRLGILYGRKHDVASAVVTFEKAESIYRAAGNDEGRAEVLYQRGYMYNGAGKLADARQNLEQALELARASDNQYQRVLSLLALSSVMLSDNKQLAEAERYTREAVDFARANGMFNLTARGLVDLGNVFFTGGDFPQAEEHFRQALELAQRYGMRRMEARAALSLGSVLTSQTRTDDALPFLRQSLAFYQQGGYRREASQALTLLARTMRQKGDYAGALQAFEQQLQLARQENNTSQVVLSLNDVGRVLALQSRYTEALKYFEESYAITKSSNDQLHMGYCLINRANVLWRLGRYDEAGALLEQVDAVTNQQPGAYKALEAEVLHSRFEIALSERRLPEAKALAGRALAEGKFVDINVEARRVLGLALSFSGAKREGRAMCERAAQDARSAGEQMRLLSLLALAEASLESGNTEDAMADASQAQESFARTGQQDLEWLACLLEARARLRAGDPADARRHAAHADELLAALRQKWGDAAYAGFLSRPDVQFSRKQLGEIPG
ncbi:MAG: tetratricopeptide repeat protein [Acidobacteria bacterium]|nr:tetratricopeptide repeat protein [Acidobacteriota bacterium]